jgi:hypothetical protein
METRLAAKLRAMRGQGESYTDLILRLFVGRDVDGQIIAVRRMLDQLFSVLDCRTHVVSAARLATECRACILGRRVSSVQHGNAAMPKPPATGDLASALAP